MEDALKFIEARRVEEPILGQMQTIEEEEQVILATVAPTKKKTYGNK